MPGESKDQKPIDIPPEVRAKLETATEEVKKLHTARQQSVPSSPQLQTPPSGNQIWAQALVDLVTNEKTAEVLGRIIAAWNEGSKVEKKRLAMERERSKRDTRYAYSLAIVVFLCVVGLTAIGKLQEASAVPLIGGAVGALFVRKE